MQFRHQVTANKKSKFFQIIKINLDKKINQQLCSPEGIGVYHAQGSDADLHDLPVHTNEGHHLVEQVCSIQLQLVPPTTSF